MDFSLIPIWVYIIMAICLLYLIFIPFHWIPNLIADLIGVVGPAIYFGIVLPTQNFPLYGFIISIIFMLVSNLIVVGQGGSSQWETKVEDGKSYLAYTGVSLVSCVISFFSVVFFVNYICSSVT